MQKWTHRQPSKNKKKRLRENRARAKREQKPKLIGLQDLQDKFKR